jgi:hypothetical protein
MRLTAVILSLVLITTTAQADPKKWEVCTKGTGQAAIEACTVLIAESQWRGPEMLSVTRTVCG